MLVELQAKARLPTASQGAAHANRSITPLRTHALLLEVESCSGLQVTLLLSRPTATAAAASR
jgi:hypothetical protein